MRERIKEFVRRRDLKLVLLHNETGISETALRRILKTDLPVRKSNIVKLANFLTVFGFTNVDFEGFLKIIKSNGFSITNYNATESVTISSHNCEDEVVFNPKLITTIAYSQQESGWLFCNVDFFNGSKILFRNRNFKTIL